jgi:proteasome accessory factor B
VVNRHGRWYVAGFDRDRTQERVFRLSRIDGPVTFTGPPGSVTVPLGTDVRNLVQAWDGAPPSVRTAILRIRQDTGYGLRRRASSDRPDKEGWDLVEVSFADDGWYADYIASFGSDVVVIEPVDLREAVIGRLKGALT